MFYQPDEPSASESSIQRYARIATLETVIQIREKQRSSRRMLLAMTAMFALVLGLATVLGWI